MSAPELAACPFCGGGAKRFGSNMVGCEDQTNCGAYVDWGHYTRGDGPVEAWNRRSPDLTALRAQVETLREALSGLIDWFDTNGIEESRLDEARAALKAVEAHK